MNLTTPPPKKLSELIDLAISDAKKLDRSRYKPNWMIWHQPARTSRGSTTRGCMVCLAGAIIAGTLKCPPETAIDIACSDFADPKSTTITDPQWRDALWALDSAREGLWTAAYEALYRFDPEKKLDADVYDALNAIPRPAYSEFHSWDQLQAHLTSLSICASQLRELDL